MKTYRCNISDRLRTVCRCSGASCVRFRSKNDPDRIYADPDNTLDRNVSNERE